MLAKMRMGLAAVVMLLAMAGQARATIVESADVMIGGSPFETFTDTSTGLTWLDLDNFWDDTSTFDSITAQLSGSGFHLASLSELLTLQASIPAVPANFASEVVIAGGNFIGNPHPGVDRNIMWGIFDDGDLSDGFTYSWKEGTDTDWQFESDPLSTGSTTLRSESPINQDLGAWVVSSVPEPASLGLLSIAAIGLAVRTALRRRREARETEPSEQCLLASGVFRQQAV